ncbi:MAG: hypothetical protein J6P82_06440 [Bacteroidales bacterium]|jgi:hypothetical protein|nr:hypothetical protein [Bacteroidales bacterium]MBP5213431.1 hypothetical protein [Bacteroidales bacterium]MBP5763519.1 hypothetical protein [Bacteroidales bacterium]
MKYVERVAYVLLLVAIIIAFSYPIPAAYLASVGAAGIAIVRLRERYEGTNTRLRRIMRIRRLTGIAFVVGAGLMFREGNYWLIAYVIAVVLEFYTMFVIEHESRK